MKKTLTAMALALSLSAMPVHATSQDTAKVDAEIVAQDARDTSSDEVDTLIAAIGIALLLMMAGGAF